MITISFDFDDTLSHPSVQNVAKRLIDAGHDVWVTTARPVQFCEDVYFVTDHLAIPRNRVHFCNLKRKYKYFEDKDFFDCHLDDDPEEYREINEYTDVRCFKYNDEWFDFLKFTGDYNEKN